MLGFQSFLWLFQLSSFMVGFHPIHVSVTEIEMDEKDKRLEIMMRVFIDDLELTLRQDLSKPELDLLNLSEDARDEMVSNYLKSHFKIRLDGKAQRTNYLGHEQEDLAYIFYIEVP